MGQPSFKPSRLASRPRTRARRALHVARDCLVLTTLAGEDSTFIATTTNGHDWLKVSNTPEYDPVQPSGSDFPTLMDPIFKVAGNTVFFIHTAPDGSARVQAGQLP